MTIEAGMLLGERFRLVNRLAASTYGELWRGADRVPTRQVAIRIVSPICEGEGAVKAREACEQLVREAKVARALWHPAVAHVIEAGCTEDGAAWIATELLHCEPLHDLLERRQAVSPGAALHLIGDLAVALGKAHSLGLVHRRVDPRSILLHRSPDGSIAPKLVDFGRAKFFAQRARATRRDDGDELLAYHSPEVMADAPRIGGESDVWSLGVLLFRCVTGRLPFTSRTRTTQVMEMRSVERLLAEATLDPQLRDLIASCLRIKPHERIGAAELGDRAQLMAWLAAGGPSDLAKMVRLPEMQLDPAMFGELHHVSTVPGGVRPAQHSSSFDVVLPHMPSAPSPSTERPRRDTVPIEPDVEKSGEIAIPPARPAQPPPNRPPVPAPAPPPLPDPPPAAASRTTPTPEDLEAFAPRRRRARVALSLAATTALLVALAAFVTKRPERPAHRSHIVQATPREAEKPVVPVAATIATAAAKMATTTEAPKHVTPTPLVVAAPEPQKATSAPTPSPPPAAKPAAKHDDNPYE